ncbi:MAG: hypothetical protein U1D55_06160 [Phycisphaerae bacterium]
MTVLASSVLAGHDEDVTVGRSSAGVLIGEADSVSLFPLDPIPPGNPFGFQGFSRADPGFKALDLDEPAADFFTLQAGADIRVRVDGLDPALKMLDGASFAPIPVGGTFALGGPGFDTHPVWFIDTADPAYDPYRAAFTVTMHLEDTGTTAYAPSSSFSLNLIPEPSSGLLAIVALLARRRIPR